MADFKFKLLCCVDNWKLSKGKRENKIFGLEDILLLRIMAA